MIVHSLRRQSSHPSWHQSSRQSWHPSWLRALSVTALVSLGGSLAGCADLGDGSASGAFVDPAKYDFYDCKLLETERKNLAARAAELQGLMAKAQDGVAGPVVAELAYRNDYISVRAQAKLAEENWRRNKCHETPPGAKPDATATVAPTPPANGKGQHSRSGSAVY
jgi:hypothetical protein